MSLLFLQLNSTKLGSTFESTAELFGSTQIGIRFGTCKVQRLNRALVWTVDLTVEIKLRFRDGLVWTVDLTVEIKLRFRDGLVWTVGLTVEIKLRFQISPG